jgi:hypothetical protein
MRNGGIDAANSAVQRIIGFLKQRQGELEDLQLETGILGFSSSAQWVIRFPVPVFKVQQNVLLEAKGGANLSGALSALNDTLTSTVLSASVPSDYPIVLAVIVDGAPSDIGLYKDKLEILRRNQWYRSSIKFGFALGENAVSNECIEVLENVIGSSERVIKVPSAARLSVLLEKEICDAISVICCDGMLDSMSDIPIARSASASISSSPVPEQPSAGQTASVELDEDWIYDLVF